MRAVQVGAMFTLATLAAVLGVMAMEVHPGLVVAALATSALGFFLGIRG